MIKKLLQLFSIAFLLSSCVEIEHEIKLNKDGTGTITESTSMGAEVMQMMKAQGGESFLDAMNNEDAMKAKAKTYGEGVTYLKTEAFKRPDGGEGMRAIFEFKDINKVTFDPSSGMNDMQGQGQPKEEVDDSKKVSFIYKEGELVIDVPDEEEAEEEQENPFDPDNPQFAMMKEALSGMKISMGITFPGGIEKTDATFVEGNHITFMELDFDKVINDPKSLKAMGVLSNGGLKKMGDKIKTLKGIKGEVKEEIKVTLK